MPKESGIGMTLTVDDSAGPTPRAITNDVTNFDWATPRNVQDVTGLNSSAIERLLLLADFTIAINGVFNDAANLSHAVFSTVPSTSVARTTTIVVSGQTLAGELFYTDYALARAATGELTWNTPGVLADGAVPTWA